MPSTVSREPRRNRQFWIDHVQQWQHSGLSKAAYCQMHNIKIGSFYNWSGKVESTPSADRLPSPIQIAEPAPIEFHPVKLTSAKAPSGQFVHVVRAATDVALPTDLSSEQIHHWLSAIHQLHV